MRGPRTYARSGGARGAAHLRGATLMDLVAAMTVIAVATAAAVPPARRALDGLRVRAAANTLAAGLLRTRAAAVGAGGATLVLVADSARFWVESAAGERLGDPVDLGAEYGATLAVGGGQVRIRIDFSGLGIGRFASRTVTLRRGAAESHVTVSAYGRVRLW